MDKLVQAIVMECACRMGLRETPDDDGLRANIELRIRGWLNEQQGGNKHDFAVQADDTSTYLGRLRERSANC